MSIGECTTDGSALPCRVRSQATIVDRWREQWPGYATAVLLNLTATGAIVAALRDPRASAVRIQPPATMTPAATATPVALRVYVSGAVMTPQVVVLEEGARVVDAVTAAGGLAAAADAAAINLAAPLADGEHLHVPAIGDPAPIAQGPSGGGSASGASSPGAAGEAPAAALAAAQLDINAATAAELESLDGIGPALAARIVAHREQHGPFQRVEDLADVPGIGEKTLARLAGRLAVR